MSIVGDINNFAPRPTLVNSTIRENADVLTMNDFLKLIAVQMSNQDISNPMSETEFMNQMVQMATVQAMTTFTDVATTTYAASLVGKQVTVAHVDGSEVKEVVGTVTGAGLYAGEQIIFVDGTSYKLSSLMAVGVLPPKEEEGDDSSDGDKPSDDDTTTPPDEVTPPDTTTPPSGEGETDTTTPSNGGSQ